MGKRGQVTAFIIIGLVLLFAIGLFVLLKEILPDQPTSQRIPPGFEPVGELIDQCIALSLHDGLDILGAQGGWINLTPQLRTPGRYLGI